MHIAYRNKKLLQDEAGRMSRASLTKLVRKIKRTYPVLYKEVGAKNVRKILWTVFSNTKNEKNK
jgi:hypothetical protein